MTFNILHAYGLGILIASATDEPILLEDEGCSYRLSSSCVAVPHVSVDLLDRVFFLPQAEEVLHIELTEGQRSQFVFPLSMTNLDGLLAATFSMPRLIHVCSLSALLQRHHFDSSAIERAIVGINRVYARWKELAGQKTPASSSWLGDVLQEYDVHDPQQPLLQETDHETITLAMTLDPSLGYASRQPCSDGQVARKVNLTSKGTRFAPLLAYIGAMRFLRAQPITGNLIIYSIPVAARLMLSAESGCPLLWTRDDEEPEQSLALQVLDLINTDRQHIGRWKKLSYQVLQAQSGQQSISRSRGSLDLAYLERLKNSSVKYLLRYWQRLLRIPKKKCPLELDHLIEMLITSRRQEWEVHLFDLAQKELVRKSGTDQDEQAEQFHLYSLHEIQEVSSLMESSFPTPLSAILTNKSETMRFGHALRQLREYKPSLAHELLDDMETIQTREQLMDILTRGMLICELLEGKSPFLIIPSDHDCQLLLNDIDNFGAPTVASLIRLISMLRPPPKKGKNDQVGGSPTNTAPTSSGAAAESDNVQ